MKIICDICCNKVNVVKNAFCSRCGHNLSEQFFRGQLQICKDKINILKEKMVVINYCINENENNISQSIFANHFKYWKDTYNKRDYNKF